MPIRIFNSLTREKEPFQPQHPPRVLFYNCGPTVYGEFHIGNARNFVVFDTIRRWLIKRDYDVLYVQNITDVDDKIINKAAETGTTPTAVAERYTTYFLEKLKQLGNLPATAHPRATAHIDNMISLIDRLVERGHAYPTPEGSVWFEVASFPGYGKLSRMPLDQMKQGERVDEDQQALKRSPLDFCLWKGAKPGEPSWQSPWGAGRPGWHIECSCMAMKELGSETIDIHAGGVDLRFPHHENEIAQSEAATGQPFCRVWLHNGMLDIDGEKMSKSLGNIKTIDDVLKITEPLTLRYFLISGRYRDKLDFTADALHKCQSAVDRMIKAGREAKRVLAGATADSSWDLDAELKALWDEFCEAMDDDFNTPRALAEVARLTTLMNTIRADVEIGKAPVLRLARAAALLEEIRETLGLGEVLEKAESAFDPDTEQKIYSLWIRCTPAPLRLTMPQTVEGLILALIQVRATARREKNFKLGDEIRNELAALGILLEDKPGGTTWSRG